MNKLKLFGTLGLAVLCAGGTMCFTGCSTAETTANTTAAIEASTSLIPVEYSQALAKSVYASAACNSKLQETIKVTAKMNYYNDCSISDQFEGTYVCVDASNDVTRINLSSLSQYMVKIGNTIYTFNYKTMKYAIETDGIVMGQLDANLEFDSYDDVIGGMCYGNGNSVLSIDDESAESDMNTQVTIKNNLITGFTIVEYADPLAGTAEAGNMKQITYACSLEYEYNCDLTKEFEKCPTSVADIARLGYTLGDVNA